MTVQMLKGKIHRATVKQAELNYVGSITVDADLLDAALVHHHDGVGHGECLLLIVRHIYKRNAHLLLDPFQLDLHIPVSYTHLTLPTILRV